MPPPSFSGDGELALLHELPAADKATAAAINLIERSACLADKLAVQWHSPYIFFSIFSHSASTFSADSLLRGLDNKKP